MKSGYQLLGFAESTLAGSQCGTGFPLSGNLPPASFLPCDVTFLVISPTISTSPMGTGRATGSSGLLEPLRPGLAMGRPFCSFDPLGGHRGSSGTAGCWR